jgi:hypothetical protein
MSLGVKVHRYQSWYGEKCPYSNPTIKIKVLNSNPSTSDEREYIAPISKGLTMNTHQEINPLGSKRNRPKSALRNNPSKSAPVMPITIRPSSGLKLCPNRVPDSQRPDPANELRRNKVLQISSALEKPAALEKKETVAVPPLDSALLSKPPGVQSVREIDIITQRKIVPWSALPLSSSLIPSLASRKVISNSDLSHRNKLNLFLLLRLRALALHHDLLALLTQSSLRGRSLSLD